MMASVPFSIAKYIRSLWVAEMILTYLQIDQKGNLVSWGGHPQHYDLPHLLIGQPASEQISFLEGLLPVPHTQILRFLGLGNGRSAHVHIVPLNESTWVLMFDATAEHDRQQKMQQQINELSLLTYRQSQLLQELEKARQTLVEEKSFLEEVSELKSRFIATLSYELREPLNSLVGYTQWLDKVQAMSEREANYLANVKSNANWLLNLIEDVFDQAQLEIGLMVLQPRRCEVKPLLMDLKSLFLPKAREKELVFNIELETTLPPIMLDELRFRQILIYLITNAIQFTERGFVKIRVSWQSEQLHFVVTDTGPGLSPEIQEKIKAFFEPAKEGENENSLTKPSTGGLGISSYLIKLMEGNLKVESLSQPGTSLHGFIQAPLAQSKISGYETDFTSEIKNNRRTVLIADDSVDIRTLMEIYLEQGGYAVLHASDGEEAVALALQFQPQLIIMDLQMPVKNGYEAIRELRDQQFSQPIIALSSSTIAQDQKYAFEVGSNYYLTKPVLPSNLLKVLTELSNSTLSYLT